MIQTTWVEVNLDNIKKNYINIKNSVKEGVHVCGVVKANAYGHGAIDVARVLECEGIDYLAVARLEEAIELRKNGSAVPILCLGYVPKENYADAIKKDIVLTIYSRENAIELNRVAKELGKKCIIHLKIDTGMGRIGFLPNKESIKEIQEINELENLELEGIYTHFSKADEKDKEYTYNQIKKFDTVYEMLEGVGIHFPIRHVSNSAGVIDLAEMKYEMVRCGVILYGHYPSDEVNISKIELKPAMTLKTRVAHVKKMKAGEMISYGGRHLVEEDTYIATLPIGYADGYFRGQKSPQVKINGNIYCVVGRICMDQCMVDIGSNATNIKQGDEVIVYSTDEGIKVEEVADDISSINYEVMCAISRRVDRVYIEEGKQIKRNYILD